MGVKDLFREDILMLPKFKGLASLWIVFRKIIINKSFTWIDVCYVIDLSVKLFCLGCFPFWKKGKLVWRYFKITLFHQKMGVLYLKYAGVWTTYVNGVHWTVSVTLIHGGKLCKAKVILKELLSNVEVLSLPWQLIVYFAPWFLSSNWFPYLSFYFKTRKYLLRT